MNNSPEGYYFDRTEARASSQCARHYHQSSFEIYYLKEGSCNYFINNRTYELTSGDVVLIPTETIHKTVYVSDSHTRILINCPEEYVPESVLPHLDSMLYLYRNPRIIPEMEALLQRIEAEYETDDNFRCDALRALTAELFLLLARNAIKLEKIETGSPIILKIISYMQENYSSDITLTEVARENAVSQEHLSRTFKKETGFGFSEYLNQLRLQKAEYMLRNEPGKSICEIAYECGFNDSNYFSIKFKRLYGISPSVFKK